jgi:hypothetical protein
MNGDPLKIMPSLASVVWLTVVTIVGFAVWMVQRRLNIKQKAREDDATKKETARLKEIADQERERAEEERNRAEREKERAETIAKGHQVLLDRVGELEKASKEDTQTLALLKQEMLPMAEAMKRKLVELLTHPSDEFRPPDLLLAEVKKVGAPMPAGLQRFLTERTESHNPHVTEQEKLAAEALPIITRLAELEAREPHLEITGVQLVSSTAKSAETKKGEES